MRLPSATGVINRTIYGLLYWAGVGIVIFLVFGDYSRVLKISLIGGSLVISAASVLVLLVIRKSQRPRIHRPPAGVLRKIASFLFSERVFERVFAEVFSEIEYEYFKAIEKQRIWKSRWVKISGIWIFWTTFFAQISASFVKKLISIVRVVG